MDDDNKGKADTDKILKQVKSVMENIKTQSQLDVIKSELSQLLLALSPEALQALLDEKEAEKKSYITNLVEDRAREQDEKYQEYLKNAELQEKIRQEVVNSIYQKFDKFSYEYLTEQKQENADFSQALETTKSGKKISPELQAKLNKTPEQIEVEKARWEHIELTHKTAYEEKVYHHGVITEIDEHTKKPIDPKIKEHLEVKKAHHVDQLEKANTKIEETKKHYEERLNKAVKMQEGLKLAQEKDQNKNFWQDRAENFHEIHGVTHEEVIKKYAKDIVVPEKKPILTEFSSDTKKHADFARNNLTKENDTKGKVKGQSMIPMDTPKNQNISEKTKGKAGRIQI